MELDKKIDQKLIEEVFQENSAKILPTFFEMQSTFLSGIYKRYGDLEGGQIVFISREIFI